MKKNKIPPKGVPAVKAAEATISETTKMVKQRMLSRLEARLKKLGVSEEKIEEIRKNLDNRTMTILCFGNFTVDLGTKKITRGKKKIEVEVPNILRGADAIEHLAKEKGYEVLKKYRYRVYIKLHKDQVQEASETFKEYGTLYIYNWQIGKTATVDRTKSPKNNTKDVTKKAKQKRKKEKKERNDMRTYYAALRKGGVSKRIKRHNKTLADKIEAWIKEHKAIEQKKAEAAAKSKYPPSAVRKANKKARKAAKFIATKQRKLEREAKKAIVNSVSKEAKIKKIEASKEQSLNMAA